MLRRTAETMPAGIASTSASSSAAPASSKVAGMRSSDQVEGGLAVADRLAEVAPQGAVEEAAVLHEERIVEAHRLAEPLRRPPRVASGGSSTSAGSPVR